MPFSQHGEGSLVTRKVLRPAAGAVLTVPLHQPGDVDAAHASLGERHPQVPVLVTFAQLVAAGLQEDLPAEECGQRQLVDVGDQPGIERVRTASQKARAAGAEQLVVAPCDARLRVGVERVGQGGHRPRTEQVVGIERKDVGRPRGGDAGHARGGRAGVALLQDADLRCRERVEEAERCGIVGTIVDHHHLGRFLRPDHGERLREKPLVVVAGDHDGHPHGSLSLRRVP